ncbi:MAG: hypothetical protein BGO10_04670 [Chlamydia sp. 32-24]|nr:MAG: hypothetical protein BGO10_04670 [Chlamydia sp. 32-24]
MQQASFVKVNYIQQDINSAKVNSDINLTRITKLYKDCLGNCIQLWFSQSKGLFGIVIDQKQNFFIIPEKNIHNPLSNKTSHKFNIDLINSSLSYDLTYDISNLSITIWPHLVGAIKGKEVRRIYVKASPLRFSTEESIIKRIEARGFTKKAGDPNAWINEKKGLELHIDRPDEGNNKGEILHIDISLTNEPLSDDTDILTNKQKHEYYKKIGRLPSRRQYEKEKANNIKKFLIKEYNDKIEKKVRNGELSKREGDNKKFLYEKKIENQSEKHDEYRTKWRFAFGQNPPSDDRTKKNNPKDPQNPDNQNTNKRPPNNIRLTDTPAKKQFEQNLQQAKLTKSYNSNHPDNPVSEKGSTARDTGGVECRIEYIEGLFDSIDELFENEFYFCLPNLPDNTVPFSNNELKQILRELAIGIYVHNTVPFFSLHFNQQGQLYPIIHPAYKNTLVGRTIAMLDYIMKGFLNGGVFTEEFIDKWEQVRSNDLDSSFSEMIDFEEYVKEHLGEQTDYHSVRQLISSRKLRGLEKFAETLLNKLFLNEPNLLSDYSEFSNSFRIIAKQNSIQKEGNVFVIDSDFDVEYTIQPSARYEQELERFYRENGSLPNSFAILKEAFESIKNEIHDKMTKLPICQKYFSILSVINFFSSYFLTLKKYNKMPSLSTFSISKKEVCPSLFPHLPLKSLKQEEVKINKKFWENFVLNKYKELYSFLDNFVEASQLKINEESGFFILLSGEIKNYLLVESNAILKRFFSENDKVITKASKKIALKVIKNIADEFVKFFNSYKFPLVGSQTRITSFISEMIKLIPEEIEVISHQLLRSLSELTQEEVTEGKRVVGGCGLKLERKAITNSALGKTIIEEKLDELVTTTEESWNLLSVGNNEKKTAFFKLHIEDLPPNVEDYDWMETSLIATEQGGSEILQTFVDAFTAIQQNNAELFELILEENPELKNFQDKNGRSLVHYASQISNVYYIEALKRYDFDLYLPDNDGFTPLHYAAMQGTLSSLQFLTFGNPKNLNVKSKEDTTPLIVAIQHGQKEVVEYLLEMGVKLLSSTTGYNPLHCALHYQEEELFYILAKHAKKELITLMNENSEEGGTPLMLACEIDSLPLVQFMVKNGANVGLVRKDGLTALEVAFRKKFYDIADYLIRYCIPSKYAIEYVVKKGDLEALGVLLKSPSVATHKNAFDENILQMAIHYGNIPVAVHLIDYLDSSAFYSLNKEKENAIQVAIECGFWDTLEAFYKKGVDLSSYSFYFEIIKKPYYPLQKKFYKDQLYTEEQRKELIKASIEFGNYPALTSIFNVSDEELKAFQGENGWNIFHYMAKFDGVYLLRKLIRNEQDLLKITEDGKSLAYIAAENGSIKVLSYLLNLYKQNNIHLKNQYNAKHLLWGAIFHNHLEAVELILKFSDDDVCQKEIDEEGNTPLHIAAMTSSSSLLEKLATISGYNKQNNKGLTPTYYLIRGSATQFLQPLLEKGICKISASELYAAVNQPDPFLLQLVIIAQNNIDIVAKSGHTALSLAVVANNFEACEALIKLGSNSQHVVKGKSILQLAIEKGHLRIIKLLLKPSHIIKKPHLLHFACQLGNIACVTLLLEAGFSSRNKDDSGKNAIDYACNSEIKKLVSQGSEAFHKKTNRFRESLSLLVGQSSIGKKMIEAFSSLKQILPKELLEQFPKNNTTIDESFEKFKAVFTTLKEDEITFIEVDNSRMWGPPLLLLLHFLTNPLIEKNEELIEFIKAEVKKIKVDNFVDSEGNTLAHLLLQLDISPSYYPHLHLTKANYKKITPLHHAIRHSNEESLKTLLNLLSPNDLELEDRKGKTPLFYAIELEDEKKVSLLLKKGVNVNHKDFHHMTPLSYACVNEKQNLMALLIKHKADVNIPFSYGRTTLLQYAMIKQLDQIALFLLRKGADANLFDETNRSAVTEAIETENTQILRFIDATNQSLKIKTKEGHLPSHLAIDFGSLSVLELFKDLYVPIDTKLSLKQLGHLTSKEKISPLLIALKNEKMDLFHFLQKETNENIEDLIRDNIDKFSLNCGTFELFKTLKIAQNPKVIRQAIISAIKADQTRVVEKLYNLGINKGLELKNGYNGLHYASYFGSLQTTSYLLKQGLDPNHKGLAKETPLEIAIKQKHFHQLKLLLDHQLVKFTYNIDEKHGDGQTLMHLAVEANNLKGLMYLIYSGASLEVKNYSGLTPLQIAAISGNRELLGLLLFAGADYSVKTIKGDELADLIEEDARDASLILEKFLDVKEKFPGDSNLHLAIRLKEINSLILLMQTDDINAMNNDGLTPLHLSIHNEYSWATQKLLQLKVDVNTIDNKGESPLWTACIDKKNKVLSRTLINLDANMDITIDNHSLNHHLQKLFM